VGRQSTIEAPERHTAHCSVGDSDSDSTKRRPEKLTKPALSALLSQAQASPTFTAYQTDAAQTGLAVLVRRGRVAFCFTYTTAQGKRVREHLDYWPSLSLDSARQIAKERQVKALSGIDPREARKKEERLATTLADVAAGYLADLRRRAETGAARGKRSGHAEASRLLSRYVLPVLGRHRLCELTGEQVRRLHHSLRETPPTANRALAALSAVLSWAERAELVPPGFSNPCRFVAKFRESGIRRALTPGELEALGKALTAAEESGSVHPSAVLCIRLLCLTGFRRSEIVGHGMVARRGDREGLRWGDIDLTAGRITLRDSKTGPQVRTIGQAAIDLLRAAKPADASPADCVCPGAIPGRPFVGLDKIRGKLFTAAGITGADVHSLRHSFATIGAHLQGGRFAGHVSPILGHGVQVRESITLRYITDSPEALRPAADAIAGELARLLGLSQTEEAQVIPFPGAGAAGSR
jgi:integrase